MEQEKDKKIEETQKEKQPTDSKKDDSKKETLTDRMRENPWTVSTIVLGIIVLIFLASNFTGFTGSTITGGVISEGDAGQAMLDFADSQGVDAELVDVIEEENFYVVTLSIQGQNVPVHVTKDGKYLIQGLTPLIIPDETFEESSQEDNQEPNWSVFKNELELEIKAKILSFNKEDSSVYDGSLRINVFENYDLIPNSLIVFYHDGCGWCTKYYSVLVEAQAKYPDLNIYALVLSEYPEVANKYSATGTPANVINGKYFVSGYRPLEDLSEILETLD